MFNIGHMLNSAYSSLTEPAEGAYWIPPKEVHSELPEIRMAVLNS